MGLLEPGRSDGADRPDIVDVHADDALLDALGRHPWSARGRRRDTNPAARSEQVPDVVRERLFDHPDDRRLLDLFVTWRSGLERLPQPAPPCPEQAAAVISASARRRTLNSMIGVAAAICALLVGSAAIGARTAHPGDVLWPVTQALWSDRADSVVAGNTARQALGQARTALGAGLTSEARSQLDIVSTALPKVAERDGHRVIEADMDDLLSTLDWIQQQDNAAPPAPAAEPPPTAPAAVVVGPTVRPAVPGSSTTAERPSVPSGTATRSVASTDPSSSSSSRSSETPAPTSPGGTATHPAPPASTQPVVSVPSTPATTAAPASSSVPSAPAPVTTVAPTPSAPTMPPSSTPVPTDPSSSTGSTSQPSAPTSATQQLAPATSSGSGAPGTGASPTSGAPVSASAGQQEQSVASVLTSDG
jgi:hypothetical protein